MSTACPVGRCDGSGWIDDEDARGVRECTCRAADRRRPPRSRALSAVIPRRYQGVSFDRRRSPRCPAARSRRAPLRAQASTRSLDEGRGLWFFGDVGTGKTTLAMLVSRDGARPPAARVAIYSLPRLLAEIRSTFDDDTPAPYTDFLDAPGRRRPAAHRRSRRREDEPVGARAALLDRQRPLRGRALDRRSRRTSTATQLAEQIGERTVSRLEEMCEVCPLFGATTAASRRSIAAWTRAPEAERGSDLRLA